MIGPISIILVYIILYITTGFEFTVLSALMVIMINLIKAREEAEVRK